MVRMGYGDGRFWRDGKLWSYKISVLGKQVKRERAARTREEAKALARDLREKFLAEARSSGEGGPLTLLDLKSFLLADYRNRGRAAGTFDALEVSWKTLEAFFGKARPLSDLTSTEIRRFWSYRSGQKRRPATIRREIAFLKRAWAVASEADPDLPVPRFPRIEVGDNARTGFFASRGELEKFTAGMAEPLPDLFAFLYWTGWRLREVLRLSWRDVNFDAGQVWLYRSKTGHTRVYPFEYAPVLREILERQRARTDALETGLGRIIPHVWHRKGEPIVDVRTAWKGAETRSGLKRLRHDFRRSAVRNLERAGVPQSVGMALTGIRDPYTYARYARAGRADLDTGVKRLAKLWDGERGARPTVRKLYGRKG